MAVNHQDEENIALEIAEDKRLLRLGVNPDGDPLEIMLQVSRQAQFFRDEDTESNRKSLPMKGKTGLSSSAWTTTPI